ncbi:hypothetical protein MGYG_07728 [Nannizzia gypsea CBS 118893]|uniref:Peroxin 11C n=1 Tax=Arthroderma gypseum (strain ATCC MYA-4604 / CBS 118893) TaxID=535722 RepID=E4V3Z6_ARTGP|nr:hypothetical protein MGYG_07728 [Nannizzia gypsea CBS 118893]EFR04720.1 hypothetical protein MGYG_07728 [Nannizzia gypsea CBS 118893]
MEESLTESTVLVDIAPQPARAEQKKVEPDEKKTKKPPSGLAALDSTLLRLNKFISSAHGTERAFATVGYSAHILHYALTHSRTLNRLALSALGRKPPVSSRSKGAAAASAAAASHPHLLALASLVSETRTSLRLLGLLPLWAWGSSTYKSPPTDPVLRAIAYTQVLACVIFQLLENVAFLASKGVLSKRAVERWGSLPKWSLWSVRAWLVHVVLEFVRVARESQVEAARRRRDGFKQDEKKEKDAADAERGLREKTKEEAVKMALKVRAWRKSLVNSLAWLPLCLHWSVDGGIGVPASLVGVLSLTAGAWGIHDLWLST